MKPISKTIEKTSEPRVSPNLGLDKNYDIVVVTDSDIIPMRYTTDQLNAELLNVEDVFDRALCLFLLLGDTAKSVIDGRIEGNKLEIGVLAPSVTPEVLSVLKQYVQGKDIIFTDNGFTYTSHSSVPVEVKFIKGKYSFLENPDFKFYFAAEYRLPNPFKDYWEARGEIQ